MSTPIQNNTTELRSLLDAVNALSSAGTVQRKTGTFTTSADGMFAIDCGFRPDYVMFTQGKFGYEIYPYIATGTFETSDYFDAVLWETSDQWATKCLVYDISGGRTETGIAGAIYAIGADFSALPSVGMAVDYVAVKYT